MYHHHSPQQGQQPFTKGTRPPPHQPPPNQHPNRAPSDLLTQVIGFQFPRPTQLPDELESALAIRGARDMDHRLVDHMNQQNQHQNQDSGSGISQHGSYGANAVTHTSDNQPALQQGVDWVSFQPSNKLFVSPPSSDGHHSQQPPKSSHAGANIPSWTAPVSDSPSPQAHHSIGGASGGGEGQSLYTPESAGSILASFGLSNEDLEVLSHYPDDQLTPDTLPFILRDIQINKSGNQKNLSSTPSSSFSHGTHDIPPPTSHSLTRSQSLEVPSLLTVTQTAGKVIDYGHASRANDENSTREAFKREPLSSERTVKMFSSSSSSTTKVDKAERRQVHLEQTEPNKHGDQDYRRTTSEHCKSHRSPGKEFPPSSKARNLDQDYRRDKPKPRTSSETRSEDSSRRSLSSSSDSKPFSTSKKFPTPTMISDFSAVSPKVYPHTCSLCHTQCDQAKDWVDHINTVNHTAACRDLRNKYPAWKQSPLSGRPGSRALWDPKDGSPPYSISRSLSSSPSSSPPRSKHRGVPLRPHGRKSYSPHTHPRRHHQYAEHRFEYNYSGSRSPFHFHQATSSYTRDPPEKRNRESTGSCSRSGVKRSYDNANKYSTETNQQPSFCKQGPPQSSTRAVKSGTKSGTKSGKSPPAKKKKKILTQPFQDWSVADRLIYLTGIPNDASEQEVTDLVRSFGKINNVILMPCSEEESEKINGQKASVCMVKAEDAQALANSTYLSIRGQEITASIAKKPEGGHGSNANKSKSALGQDKCGAGEDSGGEVDQRTSDEKGMVLITGLPESGWSESDIITLVQPFGTPSDIIMAAKIGKVLVSVPDTETAQEIVKVHTFMPAKIKDKEVKMIHLKQRVGLSTPVALYNILMGTMDPVESLPPITWSSLLVISNVPNMSTSSVVQKLVQRFGTVIKTLVLNNMVICEMATAAMALSVYKRFQIFPCIIQNNPLFFYRKPDSKAQMKVIAAYADSSEETPTNGKGSQTAAGKEETTHEEKSESHLGEMRKDDGKEEKMTDEDKTCNEGDVDVKETSTLKTDLKTSEENKGVNAPEAENKTLAVEETKPCSPSSKAASGETVAPGLHKVTQEMVNTLLVECRTKIGNQPNKAAASICGEQQEKEMDAQQSQKANEETKEQPKKNSEEEEKKHEREKKERQTRKKEARERERREKERRAWEKEERAIRERNERIRREREKREEERRERERRERKREYGEGFPGSRSLLRSQGCKQSSWRNEHNTSSKTETNMEEEEFPFNMSDFVTVDEVGDVTDLPCSPSAVPMETSEGGEDVPASVQLNTSGCNPPTEVITEAASDTTKSPVKPYEQVSESDTVSMPLSETSNDLVVATAAPPSPEQSCSRQTHVPSGQAETTASEITCQTASCNPPEAASEDSLNCPEMGLATADCKEDEKGGEALSSSQADEDMVVSDKTEKQDKMQDDEKVEMEASAAEIGKQERCEDQTDIGDKSVKKELKANTSMSTDSFLPPYDPSNPVGMDFLVPKTGFFCKVCNRFFSGSKEAEISHCKTFKHYDNLQEAVNLGELKIREMGKATPEGIKELLNTCRPRRCKV